MARADLVISRSGYTTLMDLVALDRSALIIPTPGQAEQEYLADLHARTGRFLVQRQDHIDVKAALAHGHLPGRPFNATGHRLLEAALDELEGMLR
jgi:UDP-N-acetylglucosamine:LPS N-acetylglucosamine transferase